MTQPSDEAITELAALWGVQTFFRGVDGTVHRAEPAAVLAILRALGMPVDSTAHAVEALDAHTRALAERHLEPVLVHRVGRARPMSVTLPRRVDPRAVWCTIELEGGEVRRQRLTAGLTHMAADSETIGNHYQFRLEHEGTEPIPPGYHRVSVEWASSRASALLIAAPACPQARRGWGVFVPVHALRGDHDWGVGSYADLANLGQWASEFDASMVGALPLYPAFLDPPADPSPYLPVSRLAYNEVFIDPTTLPELAVAPEARRLMEGAEFQRQLASARASSLVDFELVSRLRREVLTLLAEALLVRPSARHDAFCGFVDQHPELLAYARFRAAGDVIGHRGRRDAVAHQVTAVAEPALGYHLYAQWVAAEQLAAASGATPLYADLPIGVHPDGFDPLWAPRAFVHDVHGGAPPDLFFSGGQDWAFPPLHPEGIREDGYQYVIDVLRRAFRHASFLRVDHVMGLHRLYFIPEGFDARHGAYVSYRADELRALVSLEAFRADAVVVGEDLGTVPDGVRSDMAEDRMLRSWVLQFESTVADPLPAVPAGVLASWGTHDLPRFAAYFAGDDISEREKAGQLSFAEAATVRADRERWRAALLRAVGLAARADHTDATGHTDATDVTDVTDATLRRCLAHLAVSAADLMLIDLEELWGEREPQNRPGTGTEAANWRRRAVKTLAEARDDVPTTDFLREIDALRRAPLALADRVGAL